MGNGYLCDASRLNQPHSVLLDLANMIRSSGIRLRVTLDLWHQTSSQVTPTHVGGDAGDPKLDRGLASW